MISKTLGLAVVLATVTLSAGCQTVAAQSAPPRLSDVEAVERARFQAWTSADATAMRTFLADDLVYCHSTGVCQNKEDIIAAIASRDAIYHSMEVIVMKPRALASGVVLINGTLQLRVESAGKINDFKATYTDVYVRRNGRWQMTAWQSTRIP